MSADRIDRLNAALEGRYRIVRELGEGGMATVYLADDLRHERKVALKVLKPELAAVVGAERFLAEIKTTANLQHPRILPLFDSGEADSFLFYVMPYVEGETLRDRLDREKQLPVAEAVRIATAVAHALATAHEQGIVHRDIKPANILLSRGEPLVSDFGIALAVGAAGGPRLTETGLSVGTPYYMSPEQATGDQVVGPPSDIYSLGAVLYEMLVGDPPYVGSTAQAVLGKILQGQPVSAVSARKTVPDNVDAAVRRALEKLPADRFTRAGELADALANPAFRHGPGSVEPARAATSRRLALLASVLAAFLAAVAAWALLRPEPEPPVLRFALEIEGSQFPSEWLSVAPDGSAMIMTYPDESGQPALWLHRWSEGSVMRVQGVEGVPTDPVISPDGTEVAYFAEGELRVSPLAGGLVRTLATDANCCARWGGDGFIYFSATARHIRRVPAAGGPVEDVTSQRGDGGSSQGYFQILPGGEAGVFTVWTGASTARIEAIRLSTGERKILTPGLRSYVTPTGHLVFVTLEGQLLAARFDADALELEGAPVPLLDGVGIRASSDGMYALSENGTLLYWIGPRARSSQVRFAWTTRSGEMSPVADGWAFTPGGTDVGWSLSPDGSRLAYRDMADGNGDVWIRDLELGSLSRLTFDPGQDWAPTWNAAGDTVIFASDRGGGGTRRIWAKRADGVGEATLLLATERSVASVIRSPDGAWLVYRVAEPPSQDILGMRPGVDTVPVPLLAAPDFNEFAPDLSPDGRWLAYTSDETGEPQVYVRPFPDVNGGRWQVSTGPAIAPRWSHTGREIFFATQQGMFAARVESEPGFRVTSRERLLTRPPGIIAVFNRGWYDITPDDERFLFATTRVMESGQEAEPRLILVQNFHEELKRRLPR